MLLSGNNPKEVLQFRCPLSILKHSKLPEVSIRLIGCILGGDDWHQRATTWSS